MQPQVLKLTGIIIPGFTPNVYVGWIKELEGINVQAESKDDALNKLRQATKVMIEYRDKEARALLAKQLGQTVESLEEAILIPEVALA